MSLVLAGNQQVGNKQAVDSLYPGSYQSTKQGALRSTYHFPDGTTFYGVKDSLLGKGATARVKIAEDEKGGRWARRICELKTPEAIQAFEKTVALHERLNGCSQIIPCTHSLKYEGGFGKEKRVQKGVMILPLASEELLEVINKQAITDKNKYSFAGQLLQGLAAIYDLDKGGAHADIKPENILIDQHENLYIIDLEYYRSPEEKGIHRRGTPNWLAPECFDQRVGLEQEGLIHTNKLDSWSAGLVLCYIFGFRQSFSWFDQNPMCKPGRAEILQVLLLMRAKGIFSHEECFLLSNMLKFNPKSRWTIPQAWSYFQENILKVPVVG